ncbi:MAG: lysophospholipid acyltransferase family protein [Fimbriimonadaceae bacterium]
MRKPFLPWYWFVREAVRLTFFKYHGGVTALTPENVPKAGPVILAASHFSTWDPPAIACTCPRWVRFLAKKELFEKQPFGWLIRSVGAFPVRRGAGDTEAVRMALSMLAESEALLMFPEGSRGDGLALQPFQRGIVMLAKRSAAQVVPVGIHGTEKPVRALNSRQQIQISYGKPRKLEDFATEGEFLTWLRQEIHANCLAAGSQILPEACNKEGATDSLESAETPHPTL